MTYRVLMAALVAATLGCTKKPEAPEPPAHNAFVDNIERGQQTMNTAQTRVDAENARLRDQDQQAQAAQ